MWPPSDARHLHSTLAPHDDLNEAFAWKELRTVTCNLSLQHEKVIFIFEPNEITRPLARQRVTVIDCSDGWVAIQHNGVVSLLQSV